MAILARFRQVVAGSTYKGKLVSHIAVDTKKRFHLMPADNSNNAIAVLAADTGTAHPSKNNMDTFWLWDHLVTESK